MRPHTVAIIMVYLLKTFQKNKSTTFSCRIAHKQTFESKQYNVEVLPIDEKSSSMRMRVGDMWNCYPEITKSGESILIRHNHGPKNHGDEEVRIYSSTQLAGSYNKHPRFKSFNAEGINLSGNCSGTLFEYTDINSTGSWEVKDIR